MSDTPNWAEAVLRITAPNPGLMTGSGTNSYLIGRDELVLVDPGPALPAHLAAIEQAVAGRKVRAILITHTHKDHTGGARLLSERLDAPLAGAARHVFYRDLTQGEAHGLEKAADWDYAPDIALPEGSLVGGDVPLRLVPTPGHTRNHVSFAGDGFVLTGDHVMGWSSTIIAPPDGHMGDYLASLRKLMEMEDAAYLPGHGEVMTDGKARARELLAHRLAREAQILDILRSSSAPMNAEDLAARAYPDLPRAHAMAGLLSTLSHLEYLVEQGKAKATGTNRFQRT